MLPTMKALKCITLSTCEAWYSLGLDVVVMETTVLVWSLVIGTVQHIIS